MFCLSLDLKAWSLIFLFFTCALFSLSAVVTPVFWTHFKDTRRAKYILKNEDKVEFYCKEWILDSILLVMFEIKDKIRIIFSSSFIFVPNRVFASSLK